jgi:hypothetical protein
MMCDAVAVAMFGRPRGYCFGFRACYAAVAQSLGTYRVRARDAAHQCDARLTKTPTLRDGLHKPVTETSKHTR